MKKILQVILKWLSVLILWKYRPIVIAITGSVGKTSTKEAVFAVLKNKYKVRRSMSSYNNEIGVPLAILGFESPKSNILLWFWIFFRSLLMFLFPVKYPKILILEMGADRPGDIGYLTSFVKPKIAVVTSLGPSHLEFFGKIEETAKEKSKLVQTLPPGGTAVLNYDDERVRGMAGKNRGKTIYFSVIAIRREAEKQSRNSLGLPRPASGGPRNDDVVEATHISQTSDGLSFKIQHRGNVIPVHLPGSLGQPAVYAALASAAVGLALGLNLVEVSRALASYQSPAGRLRLLPGIKSTLVLDDSYNAAPASALSALEVLADLPGRRKIAVLGDMTELGSLTEEGHRQAGAAIVDYGINFLVTVGARAKFIRDQAIHMGYPERQILSFDNADEAKLTIQNLLQAGDVILVKGSRVMAMEKVTKEIMAEPARAGELLVH